MSNEVEVWLTALKDGSMSLEQVAREFRKHTWAPLRSTPTTTYEQLATAELADPEPYIPGSFDDVTTAYHQGELTDEQYDVLASAMTEALRSSDSGEQPPGNSGPTASS